MNKLLRVFVLLSGFFFGCNTSKNITGGKLENLNMEQLDAKLQESSLQFITLTAKANIDVSSTEKNQSVHAIIEVLKDSYIGISLRLLGIEGAKIYITPDSVKILDRINQKYYPGDFSYLEKLFSVKADYQTLQNMLLGDVMYYEGTKYPLACDTCYAIQTQNSLIKNTIKLFPSFDVMQMFVEDMQNNRTMLLTFDAYKKIKANGDADAQHFSFLRTILIDAVEKYTVHMEFTDVTLNEPAGFTFSVNPKYEKVLE